MRRFLRDERGATAIEYGLLAGCIAIAILVGVTAIGTGINGVFTLVVAALN